MGRRSHPRKSYARQTDDEVGLAPALPSSAARAERVSEDEIELAMSMDYEKVGSGIHVTRTIEVN